MRKKFIVFTVIYFVVLLLLLRHQIKIGQEHLTHGMTVLASKWMSVNQDNMVSVKANNDNKDIPYDSRFFLMSWDKCFDLAKESANELREDGYGAFPIPKVPDSCQNLNFYWLNKYYMQPWEQTMVLKANRLCNWEEDYIKDRLIASSIFDCNQFMFDDTRPYSANRFDYGVFAPQTEIAVYPMSAFAPNKPTEVLFVDIRDGKPYEGDIIVEQPNAPSGTEPQIVKASTSGVTSLYITLEERTNFKITAGDNELFVTFEPQNIPFSLDIDSYHITPDDAPSVQITDNIPRIDGYFHDLIIDYFVGYAWIARQIVFEDKLKDNKPVVLRPNYRFAENNPGIIYARFSIKYNRYDEKADYNDIISETEKYSVTIPIIASMFQRNPDYISNPMELSYTAHEYSAIYQDYVKITELNQLNKTNRIPQYQYNNYESYEKIHSIYTSDDLQKQYKIFSVASILNGLLVDDDSSKFDKYTKERHQITKYLMTQLAGMHHPEMLEASSPEILTFEIDKRNRQRRSWVFISIWLCIGVLGFGAASRRIRIARQKSWFDEAAKGNEKGDLPSAPVWLKMIIAALFLGIITSVYMYISLL